MARTEKEIAAAVARAVVNHGLMTVAEAATRHQQAAQTARVGEAFSWSASPEFGWDHGVYMAGEARFHEEVARRLRQVLGDGRAPYWPAPAETWAKCLREPRANAPKGWEEFLPLFLSALES